MCLRRAAASTRTRNLRQSTRRTFSLSAAELSWGWRRSWSGAWARNRWASTPTPRRRPPQRRNIELLEQAQPTDLIRYGLIPEFVGRLPVVGVMSDLDKAALMQILTEPKNALHAAIPAAV